MSWSDQEKTIFVARIQAKISGCKLSRYAHLPRLCALGVTRRHRDTSRSIVPFHDLRIEGMTNPRRYNLAISLCNFLRPAFGAYPTTVMWACTKAAGHSLDESSRRRCHGAVRYLIRPKHSREGHQARDGKPVIVVSFARIPLIRPDAALNRLLRRQPRPRMRLPVGTIDAPTSRTHRN